jgi:endonuclease/exonuclease/phosphatase family metal-dependent hydrolase
MEFKLLTINTWKCDGAYTARLALLVQQIRVLSPDVILLQEVFRTLDNQFNTIRYLVNHLNLHSSFLPMRRNIRTVEGQQKDSFSGMACLSKHPIHYTEVVKLPSNEADGGRVGQLIKIKIQENYYLFGNIHLSFLRDSDALKMNQLDVMLERMATHTAAKAYFLGGDMNSVPTSATIQHLLLHPLFRIRDTYLAVGNQDNGFTILSEENPAIGKRIDYIFSLSRETVPHLPILDSTVTLNQSENGIFPSDHFGVMTTFKMPS